MILACSGLVAWNPASWMRLKRPFWKPYGTSIWRSEIGTFTRMSVWIFLIQTGLLELLPEESLQVRATLDPGLAADEILEELIEVFLGIRDFHRSRGRDLDQVRAPRDETLEVIQRPELVLLDFQAFLDAESCTS